METKTKKQHGVEIQFSEIDPLELWRSLRLEQPQESFEMEGPEKFDDEEAMRAYEAFRSDLDGEPLTQQEIILIPSDKGSLFIWSLLKAESKRSPMPKLSSKKFLFKDKLFKMIYKKIRESYPNIDFSEKDFEDIILYLEGRKLVRTSIDGIRTTQHFSQVFHESYNAWLVF